jgi:serralysin
LRANVERLVLTGAAIYGTGNAEDNLVTGNRAANVLQGLGGDDGLFGMGGNDRLDGGRGGDAMAGGFGDDAYVVDSSADVVIESRNQGFDTVESSVNTTLSENVEKLVLTGSAAINATGNALANEITGNAAANRITGGSGADVLAGGGGSDTYIYQAVRDSSPGAGDLILDFAADDRLDLSAIDADPRHGDNEAFHRVGDGEAFTAAGQMRLAFDGTNTVVEFNLDKDIDPEMTITLGGDHTDAGSTDGWVL